MVLSFVIGPVFECDAARFQGIWNNTTFGSDGGVELDVELTESRLSGVLDLGGFVFGATDPDPVVFDAPIDESGVATAHVVGNATFGDLTFAIDTRAGTLLLDAPDVPGTRIQSMVVNGNFSPAGIAGTYRIEFETLTPPGARTEGIDFALGTMSAAPVAPAAPLRITGFFVEANQIEIHWSSTEGVTYRIESSPRPGIDAWEIAADGLTGSARESSATLPRDPSDTSLYFRVSESP